MSVGVMELMIEESGGLSLATFLDPVGVFAPLRPFLSSVKPVLLERPMLACIVADKPNAPRGAVEGNTNEPKSTLEAQGLLSNFYKGTSNTGTLVKMEMGSILQLEFESEL
jgi:hypothetical protein